MQRKYTLLIIAGAAAFALSLGYRFLVSQPVPADVPKAPVPRAETMVAPPVGQAIEPSTDPFESPDSMDRASDFGEGLNYAELEELATGFDQDGPEVADELFIVEQGDPTRYITEQDRVEARVRRERAKSASLKASSFVGDDRLQAIGDLGDYAGEGDEAATAELTRLLQSPDDELRADTLEAVGELLPQSGVVPAFSADPLSDDEVDRVIEALQERETP